MSAGLAQDSEKSTAPAETPESQGPVLSATSQGFFPPPEPAVLRRSLIISGSASFFGAMFFTIVQGTVFNFLLEELSLRERLPYFQALWCIGGLGNLVGSWLQNRWGRRKALFLITIGGSRLVWIAIGLLPLVRPQWNDPHTAFWWLSALTVLFYFTHSLGGPAWLSWMADLVPAHLQGRYWSMRQLGCSFAGITAGLGSGYFLEAYHHWNGFAIIFGAATLFGVIDAMMFIGVFHRRPVIRSGSRGVVTELAERFKSPPFRLLCCVYVLWSSSTCIMNPTCYYFMRDQVSMGVTSISIASAISLTSLTVFSLLWGKISDHHGHRGPLILCFLLHGLCPIFYFFAAQHDVALVFIAMAVGGIGFCGINLYMIPLLIQYSKSNGGGRDVGIAAFNVVLALANFTALILTDRLLYEFAGYLLNRSAHSTPVYLAIMVLGMLLRLSAGALVWMLPKAEKETHPTAVLGEFVSAHPLQAAYSFVKFLAGREGWVEVETVAEETPKVTALDEAPAQQK